MTSGREDEEFFRQRGFGQKIGFGERPALIVIDMIKAFTNPDMPLGANLEPQLAAQQPHPVQRRGWHVGNRLWKPWGCRRTACPVGLATTP